MSRILAKEGGLLDCTLLQLSPCSKFHWAAIGLSTSYSLRTHGCSPTWPLQFSHLPCLLGKWATYIKDIISAREMKIIWGVHSSLQSFGFTSFLALFQFTLGSCLWLFVRKRVTHLFTLGGIPVSQQSSEPWPLPRLVTYCQCVAPVTTSVAKTASLLLFFYLISILEIHICISNTSLSF